MSLSSLCNETCDIERKTTAAASASNKGGHVVTYAVQYNDLAVSRPQQPSGGTRLEAMKRQLEVSDVFYTPTTVVAATGDRLVWSGSNYLVQWVSDEGGKNRVYGIHCLKIG